MADTFDEVFARYERISSSLRWCAVADQREDYGPAGCADGCATSGCGGCLLAIVAGLLALVGLGRAARRGGRR